MQYPHAQTLEITVLVERVSTMDSTQMIGFRGEPALIQLHAV